MTDLSSQLEDILSMRPKSESASSLPEEIIKRLGQLRRSQGLKRRGAEEYNLEGMLRVFIEENTLGTLNQLSRGRGDPSKILLSGQERLSKDGISHLALNEQESALAMTDLRARLNHRGGTRVFIEAGMDWNGADLLNRSVTKFSKKPITHGKYADEMDEILKENFEREIKEQIINSILDEMDESFQDQAKIELSRIAAEFDFSDTFVTRGVAAGKEGLREGLEDGLSPIIRSSIEKAFRRFRSIVPRAMPDMSNPNHAASIRRGSVLSALNADLGSAPISSTANEPDPTGNHGGRRIVIRSGYEFVKRMRSFPAWLASHSFLLRGRNSADETIDGISDAAAYNNSGLVSDSLKDGRKTKSDSVAGVELDHKKTETSEVEDTNSNGEKTGRGERKSIVNGPIVQPESQQIRVGVSNE